MSWGLDFREILETLASHQRKLLVSTNLVNLQLSKDKGKTIPLQAWTGPEGFRRLSLPDFKTLGT
jgi:hypothetical protein